MAKSFKIIQENPLEIELNVDGELKLISYPDNMTEDAILKSIDSEMLLMEQEPKARDIFSSKNIGKEMIIEQKQKAKPTEYEIELGVKIV